MNYKLKLHKLRLYICLIFFITSLNIYAQNHRKVIDSLLTDNKTADEETNLKNLIALSHYSLESSLDSSFYFANKALELATKLKDKQGISDAYDRIGIVYSFKKEYEKALEYFEKSISLKIELNDLKGLCNIYYDIGLNYSVSNNYGLANKYYFKALDICKENSDDEGIKKFSGAIGNAYYFLGDYKSSIIYNNKALQIAKKLNTRLDIAYLNSAIGSIYSDIFSFEQALTYFLDALEIFKDFDDQTGTLMIYNNIGIVYQGLKEFDTALKYYTKCLTLETDRNNKEGQANAYNNIGTIYDELGNMEKALDNYNKALELNTELNLKIGIETALSNIGLINIKLGNYQIAFSNFTESIKIAREIKDNYNLSNIYNNFANLYLHQKKYTEAKSYLNLATGLALKIDAKQYLLESYSLYSQLYTEQNSYKKAFDYFKLYSELNESILETKNTNKIADIKLRFETDFLEAENEILKKDNEIHILELQKQKNIKNYWIAFSVLILALSILGFNQVRLKKKTNKLLGIKNNQLNETNKRLIESEQNLKELNATKDKFFSIIAHDLKNPLQPLLGFSEILYKNHEKLDKVAISEYSKLIYESSHILYKLLSNLLEWSKLQLGSISISPQQINVYDILNDLLEIHYMSANNKNISILNLTKEDTVINADKYTISTILSNLISNSIKFTDRGGEISISAEVVGEKIKISVKDSGKGISPENIDKLYKIDENYSTLGTEKELGTGLGLILCNDLIKKSNGEFYIESKLNEGSTFSFTLPLNPNL